MYPEEDYDELAPNFSPPNKRRKVVPVVSRAGMEGILASWGATKSPTSVSKMNRVSGGHELRGAKQPVTYQESPPTSPGESDRSSMYDDAPQVAEALSEDEQDESDDEDELTSDTIQVAPRGTLAAPRPRGKSPYSPILGHH